MDDQSFIARELFDRIFRRVDFEPFEIVLANQLHLLVAHPRRVVMMREGVQFEDQDGSICVFGYDKILCLRTIFDG